MTHEKMHKDYRLYSIVAGGYLSALQAGLQTAHAVAELSTLNNNKFKTWAKNDKTVIICSAFNSQGVLNAYEKLLPLAEELKLPVSLFKEDVQSLNGAATACALVVPVCLYNIIESKEPDYKKAYFAYSLQTEKDAAEYLTTWWEGTPEHKFITLLKSYPLYR